MNQVESSSAGEVTFFRRVPWPLTWAIALVLFGSCLLTAECAWRRLGYHASAVDSPALWKFWYERAVNGGSKTIVLIGASRIQADISTSELRRRLPEYQIVQLGQYAGESPIGVLRALASDDRFDGIVVCDLLSPFLVRDRWGTQRELYESTATRKQQVEAYRSAILADLLAVNNTKSGIAASLRHLLTQGQLPPPEHIRMKSDRSLEIEFQLMSNLQEFREVNAASFRRQYEAAERPSPDALVESVKEINAFVGRIQARGGQVVFIRLPSSGERLELEEEFHPRNEYWDRLATFGKGIWVHWTDLSGVANLTCPDDSHLDHRNANQFTDAFVDWLLAQHWIEGRIVGVH